ncbi:DUF4349 domain-containing protein [Pseudonocardia ailaonensis]|uniref:DUF4349 domain-containing protein n=1 Tax=Pseudonocardia ailaonensis TaxID=367279 RepID=A0ABN2NIF4_9PSEU
MGIVTGVVVLASAAVVTGTALREENGGSTAGYSGAARDSVGGMSAPAIAPDSAGRAEIAPVAPGSPVDPALAGQDVIRTARLSVQVGDPVTAAAQVRSAATAAGGYVSDEQSGPGRAGLSLRVPTEKLDALADRVAGLGTVTDRGGQARDVTGQVADLDGRVAAQQASVARVRALLDRAGSISEIVTVESELASREAALESLLRRTAALRDQVSLATVDVTLLPAPVVAPPSTGGFLGGLETGWTGLKAIGSGLLTGIGFLLPVLPLLAVLAGAVLWGRKIVRKRRPAAPQE